ncbi:hypothetical protein D3C72_1886200 [compost metagenome]
MGNAFAKLPHHPIGKGLRHRIATNATSLGNRFEIIDLVGLRELPQVGLERMVDLLSAQPNARHALEQVPLLLRHEAEQKFEHFLSAYIKEMTAADIQRRAIDVL